MLRHILRDPRYITVDGSPMLLVYRPAMIPDVRERAAHLASDGRRSSVCQTCTCAAYKVTTTHLASRTDSMRWSSFRRTASR